VKKMVLAAALEKRSTGEIQRNGTSKPDRGDRLTCSGGGGGRGGFVCGRLPGDAPRCGTCELNRDALLFMRDEPIPTSQILMNPNQKIVKRFLHTLTCSDARASSAKASRIRSRRIRNVPSVLRSRSTRKPLAFGFRDNFSPLIP